MPHLPAGRREPGIGGVENTRLRLETANATLKLTTLEPQEETPGHAHARPQMVIALDDFTLENHIEGQPVRTLSLMKGEWAWIVQTGVNHFLKNASSNTARFLSLEPR